MKVSSATASFDSHESIHRTSQESGASQAYVWPHIKRYFHKLDRFMTAIAHAEGGDLDSVQKILDEDRTVKRTQHRPAGFGGMEWQ